MLCQNTWEYQRSKEQVTKIKKQFSRGKSMASFKEVLSKVTLNLYILSFHVALNVVTAINYFSPHHFKKWSTLSSHFLVHCMEYLCRVWKS